MMKPAASGVATFRMSEQKSAEGIVAVVAGFPCPHDEGPNAKMSAGLR